MISTVFDRFSIRSKLIAIVAAPLAVIVLLAAQGYFLRAGKAESANNDTARLRAIAAVRQLQHEVELESLYSIMYLTSAEETPPPRLSEQWKKVDAAGQALRDAIDATGGDSGSITSATRTVETVTELNSGLRQQVEKRLLDWTWAETLYSSVHASLVPLTSRLARLIEGRDLATQAVNLAALSRFQSAQAQIGTIVAGSAAVGKFSTVDAGAQGDKADSGVSSQRQFLDLVDESRVELEVLGSGSGSRIRSGIRNSMAGSTIDFFTETVSRLVGLPEEAEAPVTVDVTQWVDSVTATLSQIRSIGNDVTRDAIDSAVSKANEAETSSRLYLIGALLAVLGMLALAGLAAASIAGPITRLTDAADKVAREQLPRLVDALRSQDADDIGRLRPSIERLDGRGGLELAKLGDSINQIQETAVSVATEQSVMLRKGIGDIFINLARRNQGLLDRQIEYLDDLEAKEQDPDQLEHLFKLDHMSTRMRRNAESLLVLAGAEPSRRRGRPVALNKVALASIGEIEHFDRVDLIDLDEAEVVSNAAADVAHLMSELLENATQFSPPDSRVEVVGHRGREGYTVSITDQGIGMNSEQLADANQLLAKPPVLGLALARALGFVVVGRLAARHSITVRLSAGSAGGVTVLIRVPDSVLVGVSRPLDAGAGSLDRSPSAVVAPSSILPPFDYSSDPYDAFNSSSELEKYPIPALPERSVTPTPAVAESREQQPIGEPIRPTVPPERSQPPRLDSSVDDGPEPLPLDGTDYPSDSKQLFGSGRVDGRPVPAPGSVKRPAPVSGAARLFGSTDGHAPVQPGGVTDTSGAPPRMSPPVTPTVMPQPPPPRPGGISLFGSGEASNPSPVSEPPAAVNEPEVTASGLVKRVPRAASSKRNVPGSEAGGRTATTSSRSPDEVRALLSRFHSGKNAGAPPVPTTSPTKNKETHPDVDQQ